MNIHWIKYTLKFKSPAGTSRGVLLTKDSYFLKVQHQGQYGIGECGLLRGLSADDRPDYEARLDWLVENAARPLAELYGELEEFPSIQAGLEMAMLDANAENHLLFPSDFTAGRASQPINGLIWMGDAESLKRQLVQKIEAGFSVLKMKIGALNFEEEWAILQAIRNDFPPSELQLRVDANGAFTSENAIPILNRLASLEIHSVEQPIKAGQWQEMAALCEASPTPIALDEELIGLFTLAEKREMLHTIKPAYIILKPSFLGGFKRSEEWIAQAEELQMGWWVTSALESNIGLNAIAQWNYTQNNPMASGLGTGSLYTNNFKCPLYIEQGSINYLPSGEWDITI